MATGILARIALTEEQLLEIRDAAVQSLTAGGKVVTQVAAASGNGVQRNQGWTLIQNWSPSQTLDEVAYALWKIDPETYAAAAPMKTVTYATIRSH